MFLKGRKRGAINFFLIGVLGLIGVSLVYNVLFPKITISAPAGEFAVGTTRYEIIETGCKELYSENAYEERRIMIQMWYPANDTGELMKAPLFAGGMKSIPGLVASGGLSPKLFVNAAESESNSLLEAPLYAGKYPVVIIATSWMAMSSVHTDIAELLASNGYIVACIDHTYFGAATVFNDGSVIYLRPDAFMGFSDPDYLMRAYMMRETGTNDIAYTIKALEKMNNGNNDSPFAGSMDLNRIGVIGHCIGASAAIVAASNDNRIRTLVGLDPWIEPLDQYYIDKGIDIPHLILNTDQWEMLRGYENLRRILENSTTERTHLLLKGANHFDFNMMGRLSPLIKMSGYTGAFGTKSGRKKQNEVILTCLDKYLKGDESACVDKVIAKYTDIKPFE